MRSDYLADESSTVQYVQRREEKKNTNARRKGPTFIPSYSRCIESKDACFKPDNWQLRHKCLKSTTLKLHFDGPRPLERIE
jgi:hypothetical protein